jgi:hypothetical protein
MRLTIYASIKHTALFCMILALMDILGVKQFNYAGRSHNKNLRLVVTPLQTSPRNGERL